MPGLAGHVLWARVWVCAVCVVSVRCVSWCAVPLFSCPSGAPLPSASVRCGARRAPCACRAPLSARVPCSAAGYPLFRSWLGRSFPFPLPALLPGKHFFPASALVCVSVFLFASFVVLYPFLCPPLARPPSWHARFPCLRPGVCLGLSPCLLPWPRFSGPLLSLLLGPVRQREDWGA